MKIKAILFVMLTFSIHSNAQHYDKIATHYYGNDTLILNNVDNMGLKQGLWVHYKMYFDGYCSGLSRYRSDTCFIENSKGTYCNDKKTGYWAYYGSHGCYQTIMRTEFYYPEGSVKETKYSGNVITHFSPDSAFVSSEIYTDSNDTLYIRCGNKRDCTLTFKGITLSTFKLQYIDIEQYRVIQELYRREISMIKNKSVSNRH
jgi:hypothetical protein